MKVKLYLADSLRKRRRSFLMSSTSSCRLEVPVKMLQNFVGEMFFDRKVPLSLTLRGPEPKVKSADESVARLTWLREKSRWASKDKPRVWLELAFRVEEAEGYGGWWAETWPAKGRQGGSKTSWSALLFRKGDPIDSIDTARLRVPLGVWGRIGVVSLGCLARMVDDLSMAAFTVDSMPSNFGRKLGGICRSSWS